MHAEEIGAIVRTAAMCAIAIVIGWRSYARRSPRPDGHGALQINELARRGEVDDAAQLQQVLGITGEQLKEVASR